MDCKHMKELTEWQVDQLREHLSKHRYYLGEKGIQLNDSELERDFLLACFDNVATHLRVEFCSDYCEHFDECELGQLFLKNFLDNHDS
jgi:hypothetical protein